jgi:hypothetical protein
VTVRDADRLVVPTAAEMVAVVLEACLDVVTVNVAEVAPAATVTDAGTVAAVVRLLVRVTTFPPAGAA